jgi:hypothetical protein
VIFYSVQGIDFTTIWFEVPEKASNWASVNSRVHPQPLYVCQTEIPLGDQMAILNALNNALPHVTTEVWLNGKKTEVVCRTV